MPSMLIKISPHHKQHTSRRVYTALRFRLPEDGIEIKGAAIDPPAPSPSAPPASTRRAFAKVRLGRGSRGGSGLRPRRRRHSYGHPVRRHPRSGPAYPPLDGEVGHVGVHAAHLGLRVTQIPGQDARLTCFESNDVVGDRGERQTSQATTHGYARPSPFRAHVPGVRSAVEGA